MNKAILIGRLTRDPEVRYTSSNRAVCQFSIAVDRPFTNQQTGQREADFINVVVWDKRAEKVGKRASKSGMDFANVQDALDSVRSELQELTQAIEHNDSENIYEEFGDLLLSCTNLARKLSIDSERALFDATDKFIGRFKTTEDLTRSDGIDIKSLDIHQLDAYWQKAKTIKYQEDTKND